MKDPAPSSLESIIPQDWTPQQALALFEVLDALRDRLWDLYGIQIQQCLKEDRSTTSTSNTASITDPPF